jgi:hypothetical protein
MLLSRHCTTKHLPIGLWKLELKMSAFIQFNSIHFTIDPLQGQRWHGYRNSHNISSICIITVTIIKLAFKQLILVCHINDRL